MKQDDLKDKDGKDGRPTYVAANGKVYDVSESPHWREGVHMSRHKAGEDLSDFLTMAPHGAEVLEKFSIIEELERQEHEDASGWMDTLRNFYRKFHPHPISVHFPLGLSFFAALMQLMFLVFKRPEFESAAFFALIFTTLTIFPAILAGLFSWWVNYEMTITVIFRNKLIFSTLSASLCLIASAIRLMEPGVSFDGGNLGLVYSVLIFVNVPSIFFVAANGGKITWPS
jgi:predicted heme/steroid binding protein